jgi:hypothetical protein
VSQFQLALVISYLLMTCYFFSNWLRFTLDHPISSPEDKFLSFIMFLITTIFWPFVILISCGEIFQRRKLEFSTVIPVILAIFAFSISYYLSYWHGHWLCYYDLLCPYAS